MDALDVAPGHAALDVEVQADEREHDADWPGVSVGMLRRERVDDVLVNERGAAVRQRVAAQLVVRVYGRRVRHGGYEPSTSTNCAFAAPARTFRAATYSGES